MTAEPTVTLELDDIQAPLLHPRPTRYAGVVILGRIDDRRAETVLEDLSVAKRSRQDAMPASALLRRPPARFVQYPCPLLPLTGGAPPLQCGGPRRRGGQVPLLLGRSDQGGMGSRLDKATRGGVGRRRAWDRSARQRRRSGTTWHNR